MLYHLSSENFWLFRFTNTLMYIVHILITTPGWMGVCALLCTGFELSFIHFRNVYMMIKGKSISRQVTGTQLFDKFSRKHKTQTNITKHHSTSQADLSVSLLFRFLYFAFCILHSALYFQQLTMFFTLSGWCKRWQSLDFNAFRQFEVVPFRSEYYLYIHSCSFTSRSIWSLRRRRQHHHHHHHRHSVQKCKTVLHFWWHLWKVK